MPQLLPFAAKSRPAGDLLVAPLIVALTGTGWRSARNLARDLVTDDRTIRAAASLSAGRIISGQRGYCLIEEATVDEANHAAAWLEHQARAMADRARAIRRAMHRRSA